jgi:hypothetical protein
MVVGSVPKPDLAQLLQEASRLATEAADAAARGDIDTALRLQEAVEEANRRARRFARQQERKAALPARGPNGRQRSVAALTELEVPSSPKEIAAYATARSGEPFDLRTLASVRRDERRSWDSGSHRDTYIVPTLEGPWLVAGRGRFGLSHWPLWRRVIGPLSPRADHLRACRSLVEHTERLRPLDAAAAERLLELLARYARSVPGALEHAWSAGAEIDLDAVRVAVASELELIGEEDECYRREQADRATRQLTDEQKLWGAAPPQIVEAGTE